MFSDVSTLLLKFCPLPVVDQPGNENSKLEGTSLWKQPTVSRGINTEPGLTLGSVKLAPQNKQHHRERQSEGNEAGPGVKGMSGEKEIPLVSLKALC